MAWNNYRRPMSLHSSATHFPFNASAALFSSHQCLFFLFCKNMCKCAMCKCVFISVVAGWASLKICVVVLEVSRLWHLQQWFHRCRIWKAITFALSSRECKRKCHMYSYNYQLIALSPHQSFSVNTLDWILGHSDCFWSFSSCNSEILNAENISMWW